MSSQGFHLAFILLQQLVHNMDMRVYVECCQACSLHAWCTKHDEAKYRHYLQGLKTRLTLRTTGLVVCKNLSRSGGEIVPRIGAFEVRFRDKTVFSKLKAGTWPVIDELVQRLIEMTKKPDSSFRPQSPQNRFFQTNPTQKRKVHRKTMSSPTSPLCFGSKTIAKTPFSWTPSAMSSRALGSSSRLGLPIGLSLEDTDASFDPVSKFSDNYLYSLAAELQKTRDTGLTHPVRPVTLACEVQASAECPTLHAIEYKNRGPKQANCLLISSNSEVMRVRKAMVVIGSGAKGLFEVELDSGGKSGVHMLYLYVDREGSPWECIELKVTFQASNQPLNTRPYT